MIRTVKLFKSPSRFGLVMRAEGSKTVIVGIPRKDSKLATILKEEMAKPLAPVTASSFPSSYSSTPLKAQRAMGSGRLVMSSTQGYCDYVSSSNPLHAGKVIGVTKNAASQDEIVSINMIDVAEDPSWSWIPQQDLWVGENGAITAIPPVYPQSKFSQRIGYAISAQKIHMSIEDPIILGA